MNLLSINLGITEKVILILHNHEVCQSNYDYFRDKIIKQLKIKFSEALLQNMLSQSSTNYTKIVK